MMGQGLMNTKGWETRFIAEQNCFISGRKAPLSYHARTPTIWPLIDSSACGSASLCSASLDNMWTWIFTQPSPQSKPGSQSVEEGEGKKLHPLSFFTGENIERTETQRCRRDILLLTWCTEPIHSHMAQSALSYTIKKDSEWLLRLSHDTFHAHWEQYLQWWQCVPP